MVRIPALILLSILFVSCSAKLPYAADYPLTPEIFRSRDSLLSGRVPAGWFASSDDTLAPSLSVWLVRDDLSATMIVRELTVDSLTATRIKSKGPELLAVLSAVHQGLDIVRDAVKLKEFSIGKKKYCSYETGLENNRRRVVVFTALGRYYECEARILRGEWGASDISRLFSVQQSVLSSLLY